MKKFILAFFLMASAFIYADEFRGLFGINFGTPAKRVIEALDSQGWDYLRSYEDTRGLLYAKENGTYAGIPVSSLYVGFDEDLRFYTFNFLFEVNDKGEALDAFEKIWAILKKYNFREMETERGTIYATDNGVALNIVTDGYFALIVVADIERYSYSAPFDDM